VEEPQPCGRCADPVPAEHAAAADEVFLVNGEKAADRGAADLGIVTTCTPDGEGKWSGDYTQVLLGKHVRIVVDNDTKGAAHGKVVSAALAPHVAEVKVIQLPGLPPKGDLWDWIETGGTRARLTEIVEKTVAVDPQTVDAAQPTRRRERSREEPRAPSASPAAVQPVNATNLLTQMLNDTGNADRLIAFRGTELRYCPALRKWLVWDGRRWAVDGQRSHPPGGQR